MEYCTIEESDGITVKGYITGIVKESPLHCHYTLVLDNQWNTLSAHIELVANLQHLTLACTRKGHSWYNGQNAHLPELDGCTDIDIRLTPFTNTLPINRLHLPLEGSKDTTVVYFNLPAGEVKPVKQTYTRLGNHRYRYENHSTGFTAVLETDEDGFVIDYPGIWQRVYP